MAENERSLKSVVGSFIEAYAQRDRETDFSAWLEDRLRQEMPVKLLCAIPFDRQSQGWEPEWQSLYHKILLNADFVQSLSHEYTPDCFFIRNRFMIEGCSRLICWYDGCPGGTRFTVQCAKRRGLELVNLADRQLCLFHTG